MKPPLPLVALALLSACGSRSTAPAARVPVTVARVEERSVPYELQATGTVEPLQTVAVESQVSGILSRVGFREGDEVRAGQVLFEIDSRPYRSSLDQARAVLARDLAQLKNAEQDVQRYTELAEKEYVTAQQYDQARTAAAALRSTVAADSAAVENARLNLEFATIRAPITGRAGSLLLRPGNLVRAGGNAPLVVINQIHPILVRFAVPSASLPLIQRYRASGMLVRVEVPNALPAEPLVGALSFVDNAVDTSTGTLQLKGLFENPKGTLWPGEFVTARLRVYVQDHAIVVPAEAVVSGQQGSYVFVVGPDSSATNRPVTVGRTADSITVIDKGLTAGEIVVTDGQLRLTPGAKVEVHPGAGEVTKGAK